MYSFDFYIRKTSKTVDLIKECEKVHYSAKHLDVKEYDNAVVLPSGNWTNEGKLKGGIIDKSGNYIANSGYTDGGGEGYWVDDRMITTCDSIAIYVGFIYSCWGHLITDSLAKLWYLNTIECKSLIESGATLIYLTQFNTDLPQYCIDFLRFADIDVNNFRHIKQVVRFKKIIVPDNSLFKDKRSLFYTQEFKDVIELIKSNVVIDETSPTKIYYTRTAINDERERGRERDVEKLFRRQGYRIVSPEKQTVKRQLQLLLRCEKLVAAEGSVSHNALFLNKGAEVVVLRKVDHVNVYTPLIGQLAEIKTIYIDANHSTMAYRKIPTAGPFYVCVTKHLRNYLGIGGVWRPFLLHYSYWKYFFTVPMKWGGKKLLCKLKR